MDIERTAFRLAVVVAGAVPVGAGLAGALLGADLVGGAGGADPVSLDSHVRYLSGLLLGLGLTCWGTLGAPERYTRLYRILTAIVVLGGLARLGGLILRGAPSTPMLLALPMELVVTPAICLWQGRIARLAGAFKQA